MEDPPWYLFGFLSPQYTLQEIRRSDTILHLRNFLDWGSHGSRSLLLGDLFGCLKILNPPSKTPLVFPWKWHADPHFLKTNRCFPPMQESGNWNCCVLEHYGAEAAMGRRWEPQAVGEWEGKPSFLCWKGRGSTFQNPKHIGFLLLKKKARGHPMLIWDAPNFEIHFSLLGFILSPTWGTHAFSIHSWAQFHIFNTITMGVNPKWSSAFHHFHYIFFPAFFWKIKPFNIGYSSLKWFFSYSPWNPLLIELDDGKILTGKPFFWL
jgi:hypothetical protein